MARDLPPTREASFILDLVWNLEEGGEVTRSGKTVGEVVKTICRTFGGVTTQPVSGCWVPVPGSDPQFDDGVEFRIAAQWTHENEARLSKLAIELAKGQETVYVRWADGTVNILEVK